MRKSFEAPLHRCRSATLVDTLLRIQGKTLVAVEGGQVFSFTYFSKIEIKLDPLTAYLFSHANSVDASGPGSCDLV